MIHPVGRRVEEPRCSQQSKQSKGPEHRIEAEKPGRVGAHRASFNFDASDSCRPKYSLCEGLQQTKRDLNRLVTKLEGKLAVQRREQPSKKTQRTLNTDETIMRLAEIRATRTTLVMMKCSSTNVSIPLIGTDMLRSASENDFSKPNQPIPPTDCSHPQIRCRKRLRFECNYIRNFLPLSTTSKRKRRRGSAKMSK